MISLQSISKLPFSLVGTKKQAKKGEVVGANKSGLSAVFNGFEACKKKADYNNHCLIVSENLVYGTMNRNFPII